MFVFLLLFRFIIGSDVSLLLLWVSQAMSCFVVVVVAVDVVVGGVESSVQMCHHRQICTVGCCHTLVWVLRCWSNRCSSCCCCCCGGAGELELGNQLVA